jgi:hypothetical protein
MDNYMLALEKEHREFKIGLLQLEMDEALKKAKDIWERIDIVFFYSLLQSTVNDYPTAEHTFKIEGFEE